MAKRTVDAPTEVTLPITPFLDMAFQLMFFFLATFNPPSVKEGQMDMSLPSKSEAAAKDQSQVSPTSEAHKEDVDDKADITVNLRGYQDEQNRGLISALTITTTSGDEELKGDNKDEREDQLRKRLKDLKPSGEGKDGKPKVPLVRMSAESAIRFQQLMRIMDVCYKAGFQVSFAKPPDLGAAR
jgi:biopolymer transport protein ExbD